MSSCTRWKSCCLTGLLPPGALAHSSRRAWMICSCYWELAKVHDRLPAAAAMEHGASLRHACADKAATTSSMLTPNGFRAVSPEAPVTPANSSETFPQHCTSAPSPSYISTEACLASQPESAAAAAAAADQDESTSPSSTRSPSHQRVPSADHSADGSLPSLDRRAESDPGVTAATAGSASGSLSESNDEAGPNPKAEVEEVLRMALAWLRRADPYGFPAAGGNSEQGAAGRPPAGHKVGYLLSGDCGGQAISISRSNQLILLDSFHKVCFIVFSSCLTDQAQ